MMAGSELATSNTYAREQKAGECQGWVMGDCCRGGLAGSSARNAEKHGGRNRGNERAVPEADGRLASLKPLSN